MNEMDGGVLTDCHQADGQDLGDSQFKPNQGESSPIKANQGCQEADGHEEAQGEQIEDEDGESEMEDGEEAEDSLEENEEGGIDIQETALRLAASQICQMLTGFKLEKDLFDAKNYAAITRCLANLSKGALEIEKFKESVAEQRHQRQVELNKAKKPRGLSRETIKQMEEALHLL